MLYSEMLSDLFKCCVCAHSISDELISVQSMVVDIETNYDAIRVFGIRVDVNFMIFLRGIISALVVALGGALAQEITE